MVTFINEFPSATRTHEQMGVGEVDFVEPILAKYADKTEVPDIGLEQACWVKTNKQVASHADFDPPLYLAARADETDMRDMLAQEADRLNPHTRLPQDYSLTHALPF